MWLFSFLCTLFSVLPLLIRTKNVRISCFLGQICSICLSVCLSVCLSFCPFLSFCLSACLSVFLSVCLFASLPFPLEQILARVCSFLTHTETSCPPQKSYPLEMYKLFSKFWSEFPLRLFDLGYPVPEPGSFPVQIALAKEPGSQPVTFHTRSVSHSSSQQRLWKEDLFAFTVHSWYTWLHCPTCWPESTPGACDECDIASHKRCSRLTMKKKRWM